MSALRFDAQRPLAEQLIELKSAIRAEPAKAALRVYYFQLLCVLGDWPKAIGQLQVCAQLDPIAAPMARAYREAILCEILRAEVFAGRKSPHILGDPTPWLGYLTDALKQSGAGHPAEASKLRQQGLIPAAATSRLRRDVLHPIALGHRSGIQATAWDRQVCVDSCVLQKPLHEGSRTGLPRGRREPLVLLLGPAAHTPVVGLLPSASRPARKAIESSRP